MHRTTLAGNACGNTIHCAAGRDRPEHGLLKGDLGAIVEIYEPSDLEVEFVMADGTTGALVTLHESDVRPTA